MSKNSEQFKIKPRLLRIFPSKWISNLIVVGSGGWNTDHRCIRPVRAFVRSSISSKVVCGLALITCDSFAVRTLTLHDFLLFVSFDSAAVRTVFFGGPLPQLFIDLQLAPKHVITRPLARGNRCPPAIADCHEAYARVQGGLAVDGSRFNWNRK